MGRILGVYLPIVLAAAAVVFVLLQSTIYRKTAPIEGSEDKGLSETQKALAIGYAVPIIGTAAAIIMGLIVYDSQGQKLPSWSWVAIQLVIGTSIYLGTRAAAKARSAKPVVRAPRVTGAAGAVTLNYVLSLIFAGTVSIMSFTFANDAVSKLVIFSNCADGDACKPTVAAAQPQWWVNEMLPAVLLLLLVEAAVYFVITARNKEVTAA
jgi:MFS family permease